MTSSRERRHRQHRRAQRRRPPDTDPLRNLTGGPAASRRLRPGDVVDLAAMLEVETAEARGDAVGALLAMRNRPADPEGDVFWKPWRVSTLTQLATYGSVLPGWVASRWIAMQALSCLQGSSENRLRRALELAVDVRGGPTAEPDDLPAAARLLDRDWVFRQTYLYELGGLSAFLRGPATPGLIALADRIHDWPRSQLGAFRLDRVGAAVVTWTELATGSAVETPNIGSHILVAPGEHVLGRLVPTETGSIFEGPPLSVPTDVAQAVTDDPEAWLRVLREAHRRGSEINPDYAPCSLLNDVPTALWQVLLARRAHHLGSAEPFDVVAATEPDALTGAVLDVARDILSGTDYGEDLIDPWACISAGILDTRTIDVLLRRDDPADHKVLAALAERLAEPASTLCRTLVGPPGNALVEGWFGASAAADHGGQRG